MPPDTHRTNRIIFHGLEEWSICIQLYSRRIFISNNKFLEIYPDSVPIFSLLLLLLLLLSLLFFPKRVTRPAGGLIIEIGQLFLAPLNNHVHPIRLPDWYWRVNPNWQTVRFSTAILTIISGAPEVLMTKYYAGTIFFLVFFFRISWCFQTKQKRWRSLIFFLTRHCEK